jgi:GDPmannose 4,6-dehydratase
VVANYREGYGLFACNGILFNHDSPLRPSRFVTRKIVNAAAGIAKGSKEKLTLGNLQVRRDWGWAPEYVEAKRRMLQQETPDDYVVATGRLSSLEKFVAAAFGAVALEWREHVINDPTLLRPTDLAGCAGNARRAAERLGWRATITMPEIAVALVRAETAAD